MIDQYLLTIFKAVIVRSNYTG